MEKKEKRDKFQKIKKYLPFVKKSKPFVEENENKKIKKLIRKIENGEINDKKIVKLKGSLRNALINEIIKINKRKLLKNPKGNKEANEKLISSAISGKITLLLKALLKGANINTKYGEWKTTVLHNIASYDKRLHILIFLIKNKQMFELIRNILYSKDGKNQTILKKTDTFNVITNSYLIKMGYNPLIGNYEIKEFKQRYKNLISRIKTRENIKEILKENPDFNKEVFELGLALYFAENCDERLSLVIK